MKATTRLFGDIDISEDRVIHFVGGLVGFPELTDFALIHEDAEDASCIQWLQSLQNGNFAMPVVNPLSILTEYNPVVEDELLIPLGEIDPEDLLVLVTVSVPEEIENMTLNLKGPIVINTKNAKACQVIAEKEEVKFRIYDILKERKAGE